MNKLDNVKYFILGFILGFLIGFILMNMPDIMKNSATYIMLQRQSVIERSK